MVEPVTAMVVSPAIFGFAWGTHLWTKYGPKKTRNVGCVGIWASGKSTFEHCIRTKGGGAVYDFERNETLRPGTKYRAKIPGAKRHLKGQDYPWHIESIQQQLDELDPSWITIWTDTEKWGYPQNWWVLNEVVNWLERDEYVKHHTPNYFSYPSVFHRGIVERRVPFTGKTGCKRITIFLNKIDTIRHLSEFQRGEFLRSVARTYLQEHANNPLMRIKDRVHYEFVAISLYDGLCYKYPRLYGDGMDFKDYLAEVTYQL